MKFVKTEIDGVFLIKPRKFEDDRGFFCETFKASLFNEKTGADVQFVQDNSSYSKRRGTIRGLHYQAPPYEQGKLVRCTNGKIIDIAVDVRPGSKSYGKHVKATLSKENGCQLWVPSGFLHGFITAQNDCEVLYKVTSYYSNEADGAVRWNDPELNIDWGIKETDAIISQKDLSAPLFSDWNNPF